MLVEPGALDAIKRKLMPLASIVTPNLLEAETLSGMSITSEADMDFAAGKMLDAFIFSSLARRCRPHLEKLGISFAGEVKGLLNSGRMTEGYLLRALDGLKDGITEIYFHPGCYPCGELRRRMPDYLHERELLALTSPRVMEKLKSLGIRLSNYRGEEKVYA